MDLISEYQLREKELEAEKRAVFEQIAENRRTLTEKRQKFLTGVLQGNQAVSIEVKPFGEDWDGIEEEIRGILQCPDRFGRDIEGLKDIYQGNGGNRIKKLKEAIKGISQWREGCQRWTVHQAFEVVDARVCDRSYFMVSPR